MDLDPQTWLWLGAGLVMLASEFVAPSLVVGFLGAGAVTVAGLRALGVVDGTWASVALWAVTSGAYLGLLRGVLTRMFGEGERHQGSTSEELAAFGQVVEVVEEVAAEVPGRIRWQGTTWKAHTLGAVLPVGSKAKLLHRDNIGWVVEAVGLPESDPELLAGSVPEAKREKV